MSMSDDPAVLRRRAKLLARDGYQSEFVSVLLRVADELHVRRRAHVEEEQQAVELLADVRQLRSALTSIASIVDESRNVSKSEKQQIAQQLMRAAKVKDVHERRSILAIDLDGLSRQDAIDRVSELYDLFETAKLMEEEEAARETTSQPIGVDAFGNGAVSPPEAGAGALDAGAGAPAQGVQPVAERSADADARESAGR